jgi:hypothetical protein
VIEMVVKGGTTHCAVEVPDYAGVAVETRCGSYVLDGVPRRGFVTCPDCRRGREETRTARALPDDEDDGG